MHRLRRLSVALAVAGALGVAAPAAASALTTITISGATASYPLVQLLAQRYVKLHPHKVKFKIAQGGTTVGLTDVAAGRDTIADVSRDPLFTPAEAGLEFYPIAKYAICVITNKANPLGNLTQSELISVFSGKTRSWSGVSGAGQTGTIDLVSRTSTAGVLTSFETALLKGGKVSSLASEQASDGLVKQSVESDPGAIGFVSDYQSDKGGVNVVSIGGAACSKSSAIAGTYPGVARFYEVTKGKATGAAAAFIAWIEHSAPARKIISTQWIPEG